MHIGKVIGRVTATKKEKGLIGRPLLILAPYDCKKGQILSDESLVAVDSVGAGNGELVLWVSGSAARNLEGMNSAVPIDAAVVGILDEIDCG